MRRRSIDEGLDSFSIRSLGVACVGITRATLGSEVADGGGAGVRRLVVVGTNLWRQWQWGVRRGGGTIDVRKGEFRVTWAGAMMCSPVRTGCSREV